MTTSTTMKAIEAIAFDIKALVEKEDYLTAIERYYAPDIASLEPFDMSGNGREMRGVEAVKQKSIHWKETMEVHSISAYGPLVTPTHFTLRYECDVTERQSGQRMIIDELAVYEVKDGKIVKEEFFYGAMG